MEIGKLHILHILREGGAYISVRVDICICTQQSINKNVDLRKSSFKFLILTRLFRNYRDIICLVNQETLNTYLQRKTR